MTQLRGPDSREKLGEKARQMTTEVDCRYYGLVWDRMEQTTLATSHAYDTWGQAHRAAATLAQRKGIYNTDRTAIIVSTSRNVADAC